MSHDVKELIEGLNEDLAGEYSAIIMYNHNAATVSGIYRQVLKPFFESEISDEQGHALYLAEKIKTLGGTPTTIPLPVKQVEDVREMLESARQSEYETIKRYETRKEQADEIKYDRVSCKVRRYDCR